MKALMVKSTNKTNKPEETVDIDVKSNHSDQPKSNKSVNELKTPPQEESFHINQLTSPEAIIKNFSSVAKKGKVNNCIFKQIDYTKHKTTNSKRLSETIQKFRLIVNTVIFLNKTKFKTNKGLTFNLNKIISDELEKENFYELQMKLKQSEDIAHKLINSKWLL